MEGNKEQNSVEWLYDKILNTVIDRIEQKITDEEYKKSLIDVKETALKMYQEELGTDKKKEKYYFVTYQANLKHFPNPVFWNEIININPMAFITKRQEELKDYHSFVIINTLEISEEEYNMYKGMF